MFASKDCMVEGGYLSVRLKPSSAFFKIVEEEYKALVSLEYSGKLAPKDSALKLLDRLKELGFNDYGEFMSAALSAEIASRNGNLSRDHDRALTCFDDLMQSAQTLIKHSNNIISVYERNSHVPLNLQIQSGQLGEVGATIGVIANNYNIISSEIKRDLGDFINSAQQVFKTINDGRFLFCVSKVQEEVISFFKEEPELEGVSNQEEMVGLEKQRAAYMKKATDGLKRIGEKAEKFQSDCKSMKMLTSGLEVTRVMGKVESARLTDTKGGLNELIDDLESLQVSIADSLKEIEQMNRQIQHNMQRVLRISAGQ